jgi:hypothetical protein
MAACVVVFSPGILLVVADRTDFRLPNGDIGSSTFGQIQQALAPRLTRLALKLLF